MRLIASDTAVDRGEPERERAAAAGEAPAGIERQVAGLFRFVRCLGAPRELAEDLVQEAFVIAWRKGKQHLPKKALGAYLRRTARLLWLAGRRDAARGEVAIAGAVLQQWEQEIADDGEERLAATRRCVEQLRGRAAAAVQLAYGEGQSREQIAAALGMLPNGVKTLMARTRAWLEECIRRNS